MEQDNKSFEEQLREGFEQQIVAFIKKGDWLAIDYGNRFKVDGTLLCIIYERMDREKVINKVVEGVEDFMVDKILADVATELSTDVKKVMSNQELRADIRAIIRDHVRKIAVVTHETR